MKPAAMWEKKTCSDLHLCTGFASGGVCSVRNSFVEFALAYLPLCDKCDVLVYECHVRRLNEKKNKTRQKNVYFIPVKDRKSNLKKKS